MKDIPPSFAKAIAILSSETDCMMAETMGIFKLMGHSSLPFLYFTRGVFKLTFAGTQPSGV